METFDLEYLKEMAQDDNELIKDMIVIFCDQVPELIDDFDDYLVAYNYDGIASVAHKAKSTVAILGLNKLASSLKELENKARNKVDTHEYPIYIEKFKDVSKNAILDLTNYIKTLK